jgi:hypothetical protein
MTINTQKKDRAEHPSIRAARGRHRTVIHPRFGSFVVRGEASAWLDVVSGKRNPVLLVLRRRLKIRGDRSLLDRFAKCFPR